MSKYRPRGIRNIIKLPESAYIREKKRIFYRNLIQKIQYVNVEMLQSILGHLSSEQLVQLTLSTQKEIRSILKKEKNVERKKLYPDNRYPIIETDYAHSLMEMVSDFNLEYFLAEPLVELLGKPVTDDIPAEDLGLEYARLMEMQSLFKLSDLDTQIILVGFLIINHHDFENVLDEAISFFNIRHVERLNTRLFSVLLEVSEFEIAQTTNKNGLLKRLGILDEHCAFDSSQSQEIMAFLKGLTSDPLSSAYFHKHTEPVIAISESTVPGDKLEFARSLMAITPEHQANHLLLYGQAGTGKTEFARSLGQSLGLEVYEIAPSEQDARHNAFRVRALMACANMIPADNSLIIVDECDALINTQSSFVFDFGPRGSSLKSDINMLMDQLRHRIIWISNQSHRIDPSTRRRFAYTIEFPKMTTQQRLQIWQNRIRHYQLHTILKADVLKELASDYPTHAGAIDTAARVCRSLLKVPCPPHDRRKTKRERALTIVDQVLTSQLETGHHVPSQKKRRNASAPDYGLSGLNLKTPIQDIVNACQAFNANWEKSKRAISRLNLLLFGPPGTGKTEFAKYLARELGRPLTTLSASDILDCYVGESEKKIRQAFEAAKAEKAILFFDEADSLLGSREGAQRSWEVTQVNEFLSAMEQFEGILICATNFKIHLDSAALRRFMFKVEFDYLTEEGKSIFYHRFFTKFNKTALNREQEHELRRLRNLTPGDFRTVFDQNAMLFRKRYSHEDLIAGLAAEVRHKSKVGRAIGF